MVIYDNFPSDPKLNNGNINDSSQTDLSSRCWPAARGTSWRSSSSSTPSSPTRLAGSPSPRRSGRAEFRKIMPRRKPAIQFADVCPPGYPGFPSPVPFLNPVPKSQSLSSGWIRLMSTNVRRTSGELPAEPTRSQGYRTGLVEIGIPAPSLVNIFGKNTIISKSFQIAFMDYLDYHRSNNNFGKP